MTSQFLRKAVARGARCVSDTRTIFTRANVAAGAKLEREANYRFNVGVTAAGENILFGGFEIEWRRSLCVRPHIDRRVVRQSFAKKHCVVQKFGGIYGKVSHTTTVRCDGG
jgi:hypothetical protein